MTGKASFDITNGPRRFTASTRSQSSTDSSSTGTVLSDARVVDQDIEPAALFDRLFDGSFGLRFIGHVELQRESFTVLFLYSMGHALCRLQPDVGHRDDHSRLGEHLTDSFTKARGPPRHEGHFIVQFLHSFLLCIAVCHLPRLLGCPAGGRRVSGTCCHTCLLV